MSEERLKEIKDSIDLQIEVCKIFKQDNELTLEELELYNEVIRLRELFYRTIYCIKNNFTYFEDKIKDDIEDISYKFVMEADIEYLLRKLEENNLTLDILKENKNEDN